ncbi:MAG TPA: hypothetical protein PLA06_00535 [Syntrophorhabdaceae bacterium]|nr:hypothetical protein [Syntrophorhabdaceae bacterium]
MRGLIKILYTVILFFVCCITATTSIADNGAQVSANIEKENETIGISVEKVENTEGIIKCRYCGRLLKNGNIHRDALTIIQKQVEQGLYKRRIRFSGDAGRFRHLNVYVFRFEERKGGNFSAEKPAGVGFHMHLFENNVLKSMFVFDEEQQALTQNLFDIGKFFKRGGRWITAEKLSEEGIEKGLDTLLEEFSQEPEKAPISPTEDVSR